MSDNTIEERGNTLLEALKARELNRKHAIEITQKQKEDESSTTENLDMFKSLFDEQTSIIEKQLLDSEETAANLLPEHFDSICKAILSLQKYVASCSIFLRNYDHKMCQEKLTNLSQQVKEAEEKLIPKKKFGFKKREIKPVVVDVVDVAEIANKEIISVLQTTNKHDFCDMSDCTLELSGDELLKKDVSLSNLSRCVVSLRGNPATVHMKELTECTILCGPVSSSIFVDSCKDSNLVVACQQLRMHSSTNLNIYLHVTSKGILEDCSSLKVSPYNFHYEAISEDYKKSGLDRALNNWDQLEDFNWLSVSKSSPNWSVMKPEDRKANW